ncbi:MAG: COG1615 family transporter, partial [Chloroflexi bacterium]|nr:COG1615 family transporter [Chloroflexota bacterium]
MSRWDDEIPEAFRRFMEEASRESRRGREEVPPPPPRNISPVEPLWGRRWFWLAVLILVVLAGFGWAVNTYTEWLWFGSVGYRNVWLRQWGASIATFLVFFVVAALFLTLNWRLARRLLWRPENTLPATRRGVSWLMTGIALFLAFVLAEVAAARWEM